MTDDLLNLAADVLARARKLGADSGDALAVDAQGTDIEMRQGEIEKAAQLQHNAATERPDNSESLMALTGVIPVQTGIQNYHKNLDSRFRGNDG